MRIINTPQRLAMLVLLMLGTCRAATAEQAQPPTAAITSLTGKAQVSMQGQPAAAAEVNMILRAGDVIETQKRSRVTLMLTEGSELTLGQNTRLDMTELLQKDDGARQSHISLLHGRVRAMLSAGHQKNGSSFTIETPNAVAGVKFSHPEIEVIYLPDEKTTYIIAYTVDVWVTNKLTRKEFLLPKGNQVMIRAEVIEMTPGVVPPVPEDATAMQMEIGRKDADMREERLRTRRTLLLNDQWRVGSAVSPSVSFSDGTKTSTFPTPAKRSSPPALSYQPQTITVNVETD